MTCVPQVYGMRSHNGKIAWQHFFPNLAPFTGQGQQKMLLFVQRSTAHFPHPPQCSVLGVSKVGDAFAMVVCVCVCMCICLYVVFCLCVCVYIVCICVFVCVYFRCVCVFVCCLCIFFGCMCVYLYAVCVVVFVCVCLTNKHIFRILSCFLFYFQSFNAGLDFCLCFNFF